MPSRRNSVTQRPNEGMSWVDLKNRNKAKPHEHAFSSSQGSAHCLQTDTLEAITWCKARPCPGFGDWNTNQN